MLKKYWDKILNLVINLLITKAEKANLKSSKKLYNDLHIQFDGKTVSKEQFILIESKSKYVVNTIQTLAAMAVVRLTSFLLIISLANILTEVIWH